MTRSDVLDFGYRVLVFVLVVVAMMVIVGALNEGDVPGAIEAVLMMLTEGSR